LLRKPALRAGFAQQRSWKRFAALDRRWRREAGEAQRSSREAA
jgi:hypothetical protein